MRTLTTAMVSLGLLAALLPPAAREAAAQEGAVVVGGSVGTVRSRQLEDRGEGSDPRTGFLVGAWVDVATPARFLHVLAEAAYVRRGGRVALGGPSGLVGEVESDRLTATVAPGARLAFGPAALFLYGGPTLEVPARTRTVAQLQDRYAAPSDQSLAVTAGVGLGVRRGRWDVRGEVRHVEGLTSAYDAAGRGIRHRSTEWVVRVGRARGESGP